MIINQPSNNNNAKHKRAQESMIQHIEYKQKYKNKHNVFFISKRHSITYVHRVPNVCLNI